MRDAPPVVVTIAGSDCSAGAGLQADLKVFQHAGVHGMTVVTSVVVETAREVREVHGLPVGLVVGQLRLLLESFPVAVVKTGLLGGPEMVAAVVEELRRRPVGAVVVDPVLSATAGGLRHGDGMVAAYRELLIPISSLVTPNLPEAGRLLGREVRVGSAAVAEELGRMCGAPVLLKGGHADGGSCIDWLWDGGQVRSYASPRLEVAAGHGTGCTLSAAVAAELARGATLDVAVGRAKEFIGRALGGAYGWSTADGGWIGALDQGTCDGRGI